MTCKSQGSNDERPKKNLSNFTNYDESPHSQKTDNVSSRNNIGMMHGNAMNNEMNGNTHNYKPTTKEKDENNMRNMDDNGKSTENNNSGNISGKEGDRYMSYIMAKLMNDHFDSPVQFCRNPKDSEECHECVFNPKNHEAKFSVRRIGSFEEFIEKLLKDDTNSAETPDESTVSNKCKVEEGSENSNPYIDYRGIIQDIDHRLNRLDKNVHLLINRMETPTFESEPMELIEGLSCIDDVRHEIKHQMKRRLKPIEQKIGVLNEKMDIIVRILSEMKDDIKGNSSCKCDSNKTEKK